MPECRIVVLASGSGSLLQSLIDAAPDLDSRIVLVITDRSSFAEERAQRAGIAVQRVEMGDDRGEWDERLLTAIESAAPDLVVSAGFMRLIGPAVLSRFQGRIINTHPALLPAFPGAHAVRDALAAGAEVTGCTVHFVDAGMDTGPVIRQEEVPVLAGDDEDTLHERIKVVERRMIVDVVRDFCRDAITYPQDA